jgi:hypothetical protein
VKRISVAVFRWLARAQQVILSQEGSARPFARGGHRRVGTDRAWASLSIQLGAAWSVSSAELRVGPLTDELERH